MSQLSALVYFFRISSFWQWHYLWEANMFNLPVNLKPEASFEGKSKNQLCVCVRERGREKGERRRKREDKSRLHLKQFQLCILEPLYLSWWNNDHVLPFEINYSVLQVSQKPFHQHACPITDQWEVPQRIYYGTDWEKAAWSYLLDLSRNLLSLQYKHLISFAARGACFQKQVLLGHSCKQSGSRDHCITALVSFQADP